MKGDFFKINLNKFKEREKILHKEDKKKSKD